MVLFYFYFVTDVVVIGEALRLVQVWQVPVDEDHIQESTNESSYKWGHHRDPEPVVVTPGEKTPSPSYRMWMLCSARSRCFAAFSTPDSDKYYFIRLDDQDHKTLKAEG